MIGWQVFGLMMCLTGPLFAAVVPNGGFERVGQEGQVRGWTPFLDAMQVVADDQVKHQGNLSARILVATPNQVTRMLSESISVTEGVAYEIRAFVKFETASARRAFLRVEWFDAAQKPMPWARNRSTWGTGGNAWEEVAGTVVAPTGAQFARLVCVAEDWGNDFVPFDVWFDEVSFSALSGLPPTQITASAKPVSENRETRVQVVVKDNLGAPVADGFVVGVASDMGHTPFWVVTKKGVAEFDVNLETGGGGGGNIWVHCGNASAHVVVGDVLLGRIVGHLIDAQTQQDQFAYVVVQDSLGRDILRQPFYGHFEVFVPPGSWTVTAQAGPTYKAPTFEAVAVAANDSVEVLLPIQPWVDLKARGWFAGDVNVRGAAGKLQHPVSVDDGILAARAAGLDWALFTDYWDTTRRAYRFEDVPLWQSDFYGLWGRFFKTPWGDVWATGPSVQDAQNMFEAQVLAHQDRGIVGYTRLFTPRGQASGVVFDVLSGPTFECMDIMSEKADDVLAQKLWFELLNRGYRITATASSQAVLDDKMGRLPGQFRTYVRLDGDATAGRLTQALSHGQSFVSSGPLLLFSVFAAGPGSELPVGRKRRATIQAWAQGDASHHLSRIELIRNGKVIQEWDLPDQTRTYKLSVTLQDSADCWYIGKCYGRDSSQVALTNPIFFRSDSYQAPEPIQAVVQGEIQTQAGVAFTEAQVLVKNPLGDVILETTARNGRFRLWAPPTSSIEVRVKGQRAMTQRIFDNEHLVGLLNRADISSDTLLTSQTFENIAQALKNINMLFVLNP